MRCVSYEFHMILQRWFVSWTGWALCTALSYSSLFDAIRCPKFTHWVSLIRLKRLFEVHIPTCSAASAADPLYRAAIFSTIQYYSELLVWEARRHVNNELHLAYIAGYIEENIRTLWRTPPNTSPGIYCPIYCSLQVCYLLPLKRLAKLELG